MSKKFLLLSLVLVVIVIFAGAFFYFNRGSSPVQAIRDFLPFGNNAEEQTVTTGEPTYNSGLPTAEPTVLPTASTSELAQLRLISSEPVAGFTTFPRTYTVTIDGKKVTKTDMVIRYIERGTGHIFETTTVTPELVRVTNTTQPRIQEAFFTNTGTTVIIRTLDEADNIKTFVADIVPPVQSATSSDTALGSIKGSYIDDNIPFVAVAPNSKQIFVLQQSIAGANGFVADGKAGKGKLIFSSRAGEWLPQWYEAGHVGLTSKAAAGIPGTLLLVNTANGSSEKLLADTLGLTTLVNPTGSRVLFSTSPKANSFTLQSLNKKTSKVTTIDVKTLPEKCVWSLKAENIAYCFVPGEFFGAQPDAWYQGASSFVDNIYEINTEIGGATVLLRPIQVGAAFDAIRPTLSPDGKQIIFMSKSGSLWSYALAN